MTALAAAAGDSSFVLSHVTVPAGTVPVATVTVPSDCTLITWHEPTAVYEGNRVYLRLFLEDVCRELENTVSNVPLNLFQPGTYEVVLQHCDSLVYGMPDPPWEPCVTVEARTVEVTGNAAAHAVPATTDVSIAAMIVALIAAAAWKQLGRRPSAPDAAMATARRLEETR